MDWYGFKLSLETGSGLDMDALHVHAGVFMQFLAALLLRRSLKSPLPWLVVLIAAVANEYHDLGLETWPDRDVQWAESIKDAWNTMLLPTALMLLARFAPRLMTGKPDGSANRASEGGAANAAGS